MNNIVLGFCVAVFSFVAGILFTVWQGETKKKEIQEIESSIFPDGAPECIEEQLCFSILTDDGNFIVQKSGYVQNMAGQHVLAIQRIYYDGKIFELHDLNLL